MNERPGGTPAGVRLRRPAPAIGVLVAMALLCGVPARVGAQRAPAAPTVAAAANLNPALAEVAEQFARDRGMSVELVFGASGTLTRQIQDGAPFEMFLAADEEFPNQLTAAGLTKGAGVVYAIGRLVIFAPTGSPLTTGRAARRSGATGQGGRRHAVRHRQPRRGTVRPRRGSRAARARAVGCAAPPAGARRHHRAGRAVCDDRQRRRRPRWPIRSCSARASPTAAPTR